VAEMQAAKASCVLFTGRLLGRTSWTLDHSAGCGQSAFPLRELCAQPRAFQHSRLTRHQVSRRQAWPSWPLRVGAQASRGQSLSQPRRVRGAGAWPPSTHGGGTCGACRAPRGGLRQCARRARFQGLGCSPGGRPPRPPLVSSSSVSCCLSRGPWAVPYLRKAAEKFHKLKPSLELTHPPARTHPPQARHRSDPASRDGRGVVRRWRLLFEKAGPALRRSSAESSRRVLLGVQAAGDAVVAHAHRFPRFRFDLSAESSSYRW
jgi:hypothetical protein